MDPISYGVAAKQKQRIEKVIAEPDSTSGVITVPQVIATGETITVPAGRVAVLPNVQVDGVLDVQGEVFIPSGSSVSTTEVDATVVKQNGNVVANDSTVVHKTGDETIAGVKTFSNNLNFASGTRITGDFSNTTDSSRVSFESNVLNSFTVVNAFPNGTGILSSFRAFNTQSGLNSSFTEVYCDQNRSMIRAGRSGTGSYLPMIFTASGADRIIIDTAGNVLVTGSGGLGYGTGSGGTVTQLTSKSTAVTLNKPTGQIAMNNAALAAGASVEFQFNNNLISTADSLYITFVGSPSNNYSYKAKVNTGAAYIVIKNESAVSLSETVQLNFTLIKGAIA